MLGTERGEKGSDTAGIEHETRGIENEARPGTDRRIVSSKPSFNHTDQAVKAKRAMRRGVWSSGLLYGQAGTTRLPVVSLLGGIAVLGWKGGSTVERLADCAERS